jgi:hypothetical protein
MNGLEDDRKDGYEGRQAGRKVRLKRWNKGRTCDEVAIGVLVHFDVIRNHFIVYLESSAVLLGFCKAFQHRVACWEDGRTDGRTDGQRRSSAQKCQYSSKNELGKICQLYKMFFGRTDGRVEKKWVQQKYRICFGICKAFQHRIACRKGRRTDGKELSSAKNISAVRMS